MRALPSAGLFAHTPAGFTLVGWYPLLSLTLVFGACIIFFLLKNRELEEDRRK